MLLNQETLRKYAQTVVAIGANIQPGENVVVSGSTDAIDFLRLLVEEAYNAGAREVQTMISDDVIGRMAYEKADPETFSQVPKWMPEFYNEQVDKHCTLIHINSSDPELLKGIDPKRLQDRSIALNTLIKKNIDARMTNTIPWTLAAFPSKQWASKVFPELPVEEAFEKLFEAILKATHIDEADPIAFWRKKLANMAENAKRMNSYNFKSLHLSNSLGTDLTIEMPYRHEWVAVGEKDARGKVFTANMPSEELFTLPKKTGVNGVVYASLPLSLKGTLIENIKMTFVDGKIVEATATSGQDALEAELNIDEGARFLGEVALVPYHSPISEMGILFYNTLFDENASCHLAFGRAYPKFSDVDEITKEEIVARGSNDSLTHVDFMFGTPDLKIVGTTQDGEEVDVFVDGNFAWPQA